MKYFLDTNFIGTIATYYPHDLFPAVWKKLIPVVFCDSVFFHSEVHNEMKVWKHPQLQWYVDNVKECQLIEPDPQEIMTYKQVSQWAVLYRDPAATDAAINEFLSKADSWLVASAARHQATIVTNEVSSPLSLKNIKLPDAAAQFEVRTLDHLGFLREIGFSL